MSDLYRYRPAFASDLTIAEFGSPGATVYRDECRRLTRELEELKLEYHRLLRLANWRARVTDDDTTAPLEPTDIRTRVELECIIAAARERVAREHVSIDAPFDTPSEHALDSLVRDLRNILQEPVHA